MKKSVFYIILPLLLFLAADDAVAQCSMCRRVAETNHESHSNKVGNSLNNGILYLMAVPYLIGAVALGFWWKNRNKD